jgi:hypothetical protein
VITEIKKRLAAATPGPWQVLKERDGSVGVIQTSHITRDVWSIPRTEADVEFIAAAPSDIAYLLAEVERLNGLLNPEPVLTPVYEVKILVESNENPEGVPVTYTVATASNDAVALAVKDLIEGVPGLDSSRINPYRIENLDPIVLAEGQGPILEAHFFSPPFQMVTATISLSSTRE